MMKLILSSLFIVILLLIYLIVPKNTAVLTIINSTDLIVTNLEVSIVLSLNFYFKKAQNVLLKFMAILVIKFYGMAKKQKTLVM
jgi:hypothetical protein